MKIKLLLIVMCLSVLSTLNTFGACNCKQDDGTWKSVELGYVIEDADGNDCTNSAEFDQAKSYTIYLTIDGVKETSTGSPTAQYRLISPFLVSTFFAITTQSTSGDEPGSSQALDTSTLGDNTVQIKLKPEVESMGKCTLEESMSYKVYKKVDCECKACSEKVKIYSEPDGSSSEATTPVICTTKCSGAIAHDYCWGHCPTCKDKRDLYDAKKAEAEAKIKLYNNKMQFYKQNLAIYKERRESYLTLVSVVEAGVATMLSHLDMQKAKYDAQIAIKQSEMLAAQANLSQYQHQLNQLLQNYPADKNEWTPAQIRMYDAKKAQIKAVSESIAVIQKILTNLTESLNNILEQIKKAKEGDKSGVLNKAFEGLKAILQKIDNLQKDIRGVIEEFEILRKSLKSIGLELEDDAKEHLEQLKLPELDILQPPVMPQPLPSPAPSSK